MRVVILTLTDNAGSAQHFADALRMHGHEAIHITANRHPYGYRADLVVDGADNYKLAGHYIRRAEVLHFKGDELPSDMLHVFALPPRDQVPRVFTASGTLFRKRTYPLDAYRAEADVLTAITPDLCIAEDITWLPHAYPVPRRNPYHAPRPGDVVRIGHSPSKRAVKGTDTVFLPAVELLRKRGHHIEVDIIEGVSNDEALKRKARCHLFFDQAILPAYGLSAVEAMAMGIPTVTSLGRLSRTHPVNRPFIVENTPEDVAEQMRSAMQDLNKSSDFIMRYVRDIHSYEASTPRLLDLYAQAIARHAQRS